MAEPSWKDMYYQEREAMESLVADLKRQLAEANKKLEGFKPVDIVAILSEAKLSGYEEGKREAWKQADLIRDAAKNLLVFVGHASYCPGTGSPDCCVTERMRQALIYTLKIAEALRRERDK